MHRIVEKKLSHPAHNWKIVGVTPTNATKNKIMYNLVINNIADCRGTEKSALKGCIMFDIKG